MVVINENKYIKVRETGDMVELGATQVYYEEAKARSINNSSIVIDIQSKGNNSLLSADCFLIGQYEFRKTTTASRALNPVQGVELDPRDMVALRQGFMHKIIQNMTFNYNGQNINVQPYIISDQMQLILNDNEYCNKYSNGGFSNWDYISQNNEPRSGQLLDKMPVDGDFTANPTQAQQVASIKKLFAPSKAGVGAEDLTLKAVEINPNRFDVERWKRIRQFRDMYEAQTFSATAYNQMTVVVPLRFPPFKGFQKNLWCSEMSSALPFTSNCSLNINFKSGGVSGVALEVHHKDNLDRSTAALYGAPGLAGKNNVGSQFEFRISEQKAFSLAMKWYQSPLDMASSYRIRHWSPNHYIKNLGAKAPAANNHTSFGDTETTDVARVNQKPDYIMFSIQPDMNGTGYGEEANATQAYVRGASVPIKSIELRLGNSAGVLTSNINQEVLRKLTKHYCNENFAVSDLTYTRVNNFVLLKTSDLTGDLPAGVDDNFTVQAVVQPGNNPRSEANGDAGNQSYNLYMTLLNTKQSLVVSEDSCRVEDQRVSADELVQGFRAPMVAVQDIRQGGGIKSSYKSRF